MYKRIGMTAIAAACLSVTLLVGCQEESSGTPLINPPFTPSSASTAASSAETEASSAKTAPTSAPTSVPTTATTSGQVPGGKAAAIASLAEQLIGTSFRIGGIGPDEFDNSGFVYYCCQQNGVAVPRTASGIVKAGAEVSFESLTAGDIVVFANEVGGDASFVGIFVGNGKFVACNNPSTPTKLQDLNTPYWKTRFLCGRRVV